MPTKIKIGDVIEIPVKGGFAYAQYTHRHDKYGSLLLVLPTIHKEQATDFSFLENEQESYYTFFPLGPAVNQGLFKVVTNQLIPAYAEQFPLFKTGTPNGEGHIEVWWLWNGSKEWKVGNLTEDQKKLSLRGIWNDTLLVQRIESGWHPEDVE